MKHVATVISVLALASCGVHDDRAVQTTNMSYAEASRAIALNLPSGARMVRYYAEAGPSVTYLDFLLEMSCSSLPDFAAENGLSHFRPTRYGEFSDIVSDAIELRHWAVSPHRRYLEATASYAADSERGAVVTEERVSGQACTVLYTADS